ncbi:MAG: HAD-IIB family hydrolase [Ruminococcus sp.]|nr:HAD-IIB family hydrolase [Ruminococcus sp.]
MTCYLFFDIDGTLVTEDGYCPSSAVDAIRSVRQTGGKTFINTGRTAMNVDASLREIGFDGYIYGCGTEMELDGKTLFHVTQTKACCAKIVSLTRACDVAVLYEHSRGIFYDSKTRMLPGLESLLDIYARKQTVCTDIVKKSTWEMDKFVIWYDEKSDLLGFQTGIQSAFDFIDRGNGFAEMVPCGYSKAKAMAQLLTQFGAKQEEVYAFGDSLNDRSMLELAGTGVAMGDPSLLHPYADYITAPLCADGLAKAMTHFGLI